MNKNEMGPGTLKTPEEEKYQWKAKIDPEAISIFITDDIHTIGELLEKQVQPHGIPDGFSSFIELIHHAEKSDKPQIKKVLEKFFTNLCVEAGLDEKEILEKTEQLGPGIEYLSMGQYKAPETDLQILTKSISTVGWKLGNNDAEELGDSGRKSESGKFEDWPRYKKARERREKLIQMLQEAGI